MDEDKNYMQNHDDDDDLDFGSLLGDLLIGGAAAYGAYQIGNWLFGEEENQISQQGADLFNLANHHIQQSEFIEAENYARQCLSLDPNNSDVNNLLAVILYYRNSNIEEGLKLCMTAIQIAPNEYAKGHYLGTEANLFFLQGNWPKVIQSGRSHLDILEKNNHTPFPPDLWSIWRLAIAYANIKEFKKSLKLYEQSINLEPSNPHIFNLYSGLAYVRGELEQYNSAIDDYEKAINLMKHNSFLAKEMKDLEISNCLNGLGVIFKKMGDQEKSKEYFSKAIEECSKNPYPFVNLAGFFAEKGDLENLKYFIEQAVKVIDSDFAPHRDLISYLLNDKDFQISRDCYHHILSILHSNKLISKQVYRAKISTFDNQQLFISQSTRDKLKYQIGNNEIKPAIENLLFITKKSEKIYNEVMLYLNRLTEVETEIRIDVISYEQADTSKNKIKSSLIELIDRIKTKAV